MRLFNVGVLKEMLKIKAGIDDKAMKRMKKPELIDRIGTMLEDSTIQLVNITYLARIPNLQLDSMMVAYSLQEEVCMATIAVEELNT